MTEYYFNVATGKVEKGRQSHSRDLMGPYASVAEAEQALARARENTERWDEEDRRWRGEDDG